MNDPAGPMLAATLTMEAVAVMALLQLLIEDRILLGLDPHGLGTTGRLLDILSNWDSMARAAPGAGLPWSDQASEARAEFRAAVERVDPMMSICGVLTVARRRRVTVAVTTPPHPPGRRAGVAGAAGKSRQP